jgi:hypothetical protein
LRPSRRFWGEVTTAAIVSRLESCTSDKSDLDCSGTVERTKPVALRYLVPQFPHTKCADLIRELGRREVQNQVVPDPDIDAFMKASALEGQKENLVTDYIMKILGLDICADTLVGNQLIRGVSGGQRKRVTTGEGVFLGG